jgi:hypothetical protein
MKKKINIIVGFVTIAFVFLNLSILSTEDGNLSNFSLDKLKIQFAHAAELPEVTITCDPPRYGTCNTLYVYDIPDHPMVFLCEASGDPDDTCNHWEEVVCQTQSCINYLASLGLF